MSDKKKTDKKSGDKEKMTRRMKHIIPCKLTEKELAKISREHVELLDQITAKEGEKKSFDDRVKSDISMLEESAGKLVSIIRTGSQDREVDCDLTFDWRSKEVTLVRVDTKETVKKRNMTRDELQREMFEAGAREGKGVLLQFDGGKAAKDRSEVKDVKKPGNDKGDPRKTPVAGDTIEAETLAGWKTGKVLPSSGSVLDVDIGEKEPLHIPVESQIWRWPGGKNDGDSLKATLGEIDGAKKAGKGKKNNMNGTQVDLTPDDGGDF